MEQLISYETAKLAKAKGFDESGHYLISQWGEMSVRQARASRNSSFNISGEVYYSRPTQSLLQKWLRDIHSINVAPWCNASGWAWELEKTNGTHISIMDINGQVEGTEPESGMFSSYEKALEEGLKQALNLITT